MYSIAATVDVNPSGAQPLTADHVWRGLIMKAENAVPFVEAISECRVLARYPDGFLREIVLRGTRMTERVTLTPDVQVHFQRVESQGYDGWITNVVSESDRGLLLTFTFSVGFPDAAPGSEAERRQGDAVRAAYKRAIETTLERVRVLVGEEAL